jgi:putative tricarboxylic transport membrane protein
MNKSRKLRAGENFFAWLLLIFSLFVFFQAFGISGFSSISSPGTFPMGAAVVMILSMAIILLNNRRREKPEAESFKEEIRLAAANVLPRIFLLYTAIIIAYMFLIEPLRFLPSSFAFLLVSMIYLKGSRPLKALLIATGTMAGIYVVFQYVFRVVLP